MADNKPQFAQKTYVNLLPPFKVQVKGQVCSADYNEAYKFWNYFMMTPGGLVQFTSDKQYKVGGEVIVNLVTKQYKFNEAK